MVSLRDTLGPGPGKKGLGSSGSGAKPASGGGPVGGRLEDHPGFQRPGTWTRARRVLNPRVLLYTIMIVALVVPSTYFWHRYQIQVSAGALLTHVDQLADEGKALEATLELQRYVELTGTESLETLLRMVKLLGQEDPPTLDGMRREARYQRRIIDKKPSLVDNRRRLAELLFSIGSYNLAIEEARILLKENKGDAAALLVLANSQYALQDYPQALAAYRQVVKLNPADIVSYSRMANCYVRTGDEKLASGVIDEMVARNPNSGMALYRRYMFRRALAPANTGTEDLERALVLDPKNPEILLQAANQSLAARNWDEAADRCARLVEVSRAGDGAWTAGQIGIGNARLGRSDVAGAMNAWREALTLVNDENFQLNFRLVETLIQSGELPEARQRLDRLRDALRKMASDSSRRVSEFVAVERSVDLLEAKYFAANNEPRKAIPLLRAASKTDMGNPAVTYDSLRLLGEMYARFEEWDAASEALQRAAAVRPEAADARFQLGRALARAGRIDEALGILNAIAQGGQAPAVAWVTLAQLNFQKQSTFEVADRDWTAFERALAEARARGVSISEIALFQASRWIADGHPNRAMATLVAADIALALRSARQALVATAGRALGRALAVTGRFPKTVQILGSLDASIPYRSEQFARIWIGMAELFAAAERPRLASAMLEQGTKWWPESENVSLAAATVLATQGKYDEAIAVLDRALALASEETRPSLSRAKGRIVGQIEDPERSLAVRSAMAESEPNNVDNLVALVETLARAKRFDEAEAAIRRLRALEGDEGTNWRYAEAVTTLAKASAESPTGAADAAATAKATELSGQILARRPSWSRGQLLAGLVAMQKNEPDQAIDSFKRAIQYGDRRPYVYRELLALLVARGEFKEAEEYLARLRRGLVEQPAFLPIALELTTGRRNFEQALALARRNAQTRPDDAQARVWLGDVEALSGDFAAAEKSYTQAIGQDPKNLEAHLALIRMLAQLPGRGAEARAAVDALAKSPAVGDKTDLVLGYCYSLLGEAGRDEAKARYLAAIDAAPSDTGTLRAALRFLLDNRMPEAERAIARLEAINPNDPYLRRARAVWKSTLPDAASWKDALDLLADQNSAADLRVRALLLERMGGPDQLREAIRLLEEIAARPDEVTPADRYRLALLYQREGRLDSAIGHLRPIVFREDADPAYVASCLELLLRAGRWQGEAEVLLKRLREAEPESFRSRSLEARWLDKAGRRAEAVALVKEAMEKSRSNPKAAELKLGFARLLTQFAAVADAERVYRELAESDPLGYQHLVSFLAEQKRGDEAARLCLTKYEQLGPVDGLPALIRAANVSAYCPVAAGLEEKIDDLLTLAMKKESDRARLARVVAERRLRRGRYLEALELYQLALAAQPNNIGDLNNLALCLSKLGRHSEAIEKIDQAIQLAGPKIELLDSKGMILLAGENLDPALAAFQKVTSDARASGIHFLHLAAASARANRPAESRAAIEKAKERGIDAQKLSEEDRRLLAELSGLEEKPI